MLKQKFAGLTVGAACLGMAFAGPAQSQTFKIDPAHTSVVFHVTHLGYSSMFGRFNQVAGELVFDQKNVTASKLSVTIKTGSVDTNHARRDKHLRSPDFFNAKEFPEMKFVSTKIVKTGDKTGKIHGNLTLLGVTKPVVLDVRYNRMGPHPLPQYKKILTIGFSARTSLKRSDFGMKYALRGIGDKVTIFIEVEGAKK